MKTLDNRIEAIARSIGTRGLLIVAIAMMAGGQCLAEDRLKLDETSIQGASELPKVLYIVPWKKVVPDNKPIRLKSMVDEVMAPVDREVLQRQLRFYHNRTAGKAKPAVTADAKTSTKNNAGAGKAPQANKAAATKK